MSDNCEFEREHFHTKAGHVLYCTNDPKNYPALRKECGFSFKFDIEATWESVSYVCEKAYDFKDIGTLFMDGVTVGIMKHWDVPAGVIWLVGGLIFGMFLLHVTHRVEKAKKE